MLKIFKYIIINSILMVGLLTNVVAQNSKSNDSVVDSVKTPVFQGFFVEVDAFPLLENTLINNYAYSFQGNLMVDLDHRYFPLLEVGFAGANKTNNAGAQFNTSGIFQKIGVDFRLLKPKPNATIKNNLLLGGLRLGMSHFNYSIHNATISDPYWGGSEVIHADDISSTKLWLEFVAGMRVSVYHNIYMGWNVRNKRLLNQTKAGEDAPWYIPGYGIGNPGNWAFSYIVGYKF